MDHYHLVICHLCFAAKLRLKDHRRRDKHAGYWEVPHLALEATKKGGGGRGNGNLQELPPIPLRLAIIADQKQ